MNSETQLKYRRFKTRRHISPRIHSHFGEGDDNKILSELVGGIKSIA